MDEINKMKIDYEAMGKRIKARRKALNISQKELAEKTELDDKYISNIERAVSTPTIEDIAAICNVLDISVDFILFGDLLSEKEKDILNQITDILNVMCEKDKEFILEFIKLRNNYSKNE